LTGGLPAGPLASPRGDESSTVRRSSSSAQVRGSLAFRSGRPSAIRA